MPSPGFEPRPNGAAISFTNHYTGWAASATAHRGPKNTVPISSVFVTLGTKVHVHMFWSGGQSNMKPPMFSS
ncbi:hypothetical protein TNCV_3154641 [Trichonephila clavipes]|nr:hypothetical protein TNCV_3154641 [Trichonephila clavipes]